LRSFSYHHVDVFTDTPFEGNPLAVFPDGRGIDGATMQRIAREMNLSETVFVLPPDDPSAAAKLRIFTPAAELRFAGHPTVGTAFVLVRTGAIPPGTRSFVFEEGVGPIQVRVDAGPPFAAWLTTPPITFGQTLHDRDAAADALGVATADLRDDVPIQIASAGNPFVYVALRTEDAVDRCMLDARKARAAFGADAASGVYVFAQRDGGVYSRMFAPENGIVEDPATGGATGPLAAYLLEHGLVAARDGLALTAEQGTHMGRRSILRILIHGDGAQRRIEVGGSAVALMEGTLRIAS
jgi:trans-2,3-dihydro-3-hydroxyanthranilate isomerase